MTGSGGWLAARRSLVGFGLLDAVALLLAVVAAAAVVRGGAAVYLPALLVAGVVLPGWMLLLGAVVGRRMFPELTAVGPLNPADLALMIFILRSAFVLPGSGRLTDVIRPRANRWLLGFLLWAWIAVVASQSWETAWALGRITLYSAAFLALSASARAEDTHRFIPALTAYAAFEAVLALLGLTPESEGRLLGFYGDPHQFGMLMLAGMAGLMMFRPILRVVFFPLLAAAAILTQTRGIWIAGLGLLLVVAMPWLARGRVRLAGALVAVVAVSLVVEPQVTSLLELNPNTRPYRVATISEGLELIEENPVFGVGWAAGTASLPESLAPPYNLWVNTAASVGIPGLLILGGFLFLLVKAAYSAAGAVPRTLLAYLGAFLILSLGEMTLYANSPLTIEFFTLSGIGLAFTTAGADRKYSPGQELPVGSPPSSRPLPR